MKHSLHPKEREEIAVEIVRIMASVDHVFQRLTDATGSGNVSARRMLMNHRGLAFSELAFFEGYLAALSGPLPLSIVKRAPLARSKYQPHKK